MVVLVEFFLTFVDFIASRGALESPTDHLSRGGGGGGYDNHPHFLPPKQHDSSSLQRHDAQHTKTTSPISPRKWPPIGVQMTKEPGKITLKDIGFKTDEPGDPVELLELSCLKRKRVVLLQSGEYFAGSGGNLAGGKPITHTEEISQDQAKVELGAGAELLREDDIPDRKADGSGSESLSPSERAQLVMDETQKNGGAASSSKPRSPHDSFFPGDPELLKEYELKSQILQRYFHLLDPTERMKCWVATKDLSIDLLLEVLRERTGTGVYGDGGDNAFSQPSVNVTLELSRKRKVGGRVCFRNVTTREEVLVEETEGRKGGVCFRFWKIIFHATVAARLCT